jgi:DNA-binding SARP family transcriptional activator
MRRRRLNIRVHVLGPVELSIGGSQVQLSGHLQRALLAALAISPGKVVSTQRLIESMWGDNAPAHARVKVQGCVSSLRKLLMTNCASDRLLTRDPGYLLSDAGVEVDLIEYRALLRLAAEDIAVGEAASASERMAAALGLWQGHALADLRTPVMAGLAQALERGRLSAIERKAECDLQLGRNELVAEELTSTLLDHPYREGARAVLMLALYRSGCRAEALECYRAGRALLRDQLGIEPGQQLKRLHERMLGDDPQLAGARLSDV